jgi:hypothetical protein
MNCREVVFSETRITILHKLALRGHNWFQKRIYAREIIRSCASEQKCRDSVGERSLAATRRTLLDEAVLPDSCSKICPTPSLAIEPKRGRNPPWKAEEMAPLLRLNRHQGLLEGMCSGQAQSARTTRRSSKVGGTHVWRVTVSRRV